MAFLANKRKNIEQSNNHDHRLGNKSGFSENNSVNSQFKINYPDTKKFGIKPDSNYYCIRCKIPGT